MKWMIAAPEIYYFAAALWFLLLSFVDRPDLKREQSTALFLATLGIAVCLGSVWSDGHLFIKAYRADLFSQIFKVLLAIGLFLIIFVCSGNTDIRERNIRDFYLLLFTCTLAMMLLVSADHLLAIYLSLELSSYSLYILVALRKDGVFGLESGIKYFLIGTFASAVMIFGMALLYSATGLTYLTDLAKVLPSIISQPTIAIGLLLILGGFFFKLAVFPFHFWAADTYQGATNQVAAYIATSSKVAAIAILLRVVALVGQGSIYLGNALVILSIVSMTLGNLAAIVQKDIKRLLAFSTIAHSGYILIGILAMNRAGYTSAVFYAIALLLMKFTVFLVVIKVAYDGKNLQIEQLAGLHRQSPILALALMVSLFSLAGIPPTIGFTGKFLVFIAAMEKGYFTLVLIAMINVVISLYYYLLVIKAAYLLEPKGELPLLNVTPSTKLLAGALIVVIVAAGFFPYHLMEVAQSAAQVLTANR
jgi:NADH-quinone oxidoreductase subunit N